MEYGRIRVIADAKIVRIVHLPPPVCQRDQYLEVSLDFGKYFLGQMDCCDLPRYRRHPAEASAIAFATSASHHRSRPYRNSDATSVRRGNLAGAAANCTRSNADKFVVQIAFRHLELAGGRPVSWYQRCFGSHLDESHAG